MGLHAKNVKFLHLLSADIVPRLSLFSVPLHISLSLVSRSILHWYFHEALLGSSSRSAPAESLAIDAKLQSLARCLWRLLGFSSSGDVQSTYLKADRVVKTDSEVDLRKAAKVIRCDACEISYRAVHAKLQSASFPNQVD